MLKMPFVVAALPSLRSLGYKRKNFYENSSAVRAEASGSNVINCKMSAAKSHQIILDCCYTAR